MGEGKGKLKREGTRIKGQNVSIRNGVKVDDRKEYEWK